MMQLDWFDYICEVLKTENELSADMLVNLIECNHSNGESRQTYSLIGFDTVFASIDIYPFIEEIGLPDAEMNQLVFTLQGAFIEVQEIIKRFPVYLKTPNMYCGGMQVFCYPIPEKFSFRAISMYPEEHNNVFSDINGMRTHAITFMFGKTLEMAREGYVLTKRETFDF